MSVLSNDRIEFITCIVARGKGKQVIELAKAKNVTVEFIETMKELGKKCNVEVKTAVAAIIV